VVPFLKKIIKQILYSYTIQMARTAIIHKQQKLLKKRLAAQANGKKMKQPTKYYNRCRLCGRPKSYMREFGVCRVCFRDHARQGNIM
jgi:ribosomal protein S14